MSFVVAHLAVLSLLQGLPAPPAPPPMPGRVEGFLTTRALFAKCREPSVTAISFCYAYIAGVADTARAYQAWLGTSDFCIDAAVPQSALIRSFENYVVDHPALGDTQAGSAVVLALRDTYSCPPLAAPNPE